MISTSASSAAGHRIQTAVGELSVRVVGSGPPALLWHSLFVDSTSWDRILPALEPKRRLVLIDGPGHGRSGDSGHRYTLTDCATAAWQVLDELSITAPVDWVGNAWGGHVGILAAVGHPERVRSLVTLSTPVRSYRPEARRRVRLLTAAYRLLGPVDFLVDGVAEVQLSPATRQKDPDAVALQRDLLKAAHRRSLANAIRSISIHREDLTPQLARLRVPTLFVTGMDHDDFPPDEARAAIALVRGGLVEIVEDAAKLIPLEQPARTAELVLNFWGRIP
ncbi:alpha/beta fold hydrolase [Microbacterium sp. NPDC019599]|uniref:alpha/beta fold hydrolase n=1 Tax=Microbacterium sp. NPDC019599 TaxID=3154690 RepID=UPI0033C5F328